MPAGDSLDEARKAADKQADTTKAQKFAAKSGLVVEGGNASRLSARVATFLAETKANKARKTHLAYANAMRYFVQSSKRTNVEDIKREDMLSFKTHLRDEDLSETSVYNNFLYTMIFLKWCGTHAGVKKNDWPAKPEREPEEYGDEEIEKLLVAADTENIKTKSPRHKRSHQGEERLLLNSFLCSAMRSGELEHLTYGDVDFKNSVWTVQPKMDWKTKTRGSQRDVPIPAWLTKRIHQRMTDGNHQRADLIFPSRDGKPDRKLLNVVKRVAVRAGLLKVVKHDNGKRILVGIRMDGHRFRTTAITRWLRDGVAPQDVMAWVGHKKLDTILRYAAKVNVRKLETRKRAERTFAQFANVGD